MAEPLPRAGRSRPYRRPARALLLAAAILMTVFCGLFMARPASAATTAKAAPAAAAAGDSTAAPEPRADRIERPKRMFPNGCCWPGSGQRSVPVYQLGRCGVSADPAGRIFA